MVGIVVGIILLGIGGFLEYRRKKGLERVIDIKYQETTPIADVLDTYKSITASLGEGNYAETVELKGVAQAIQPLKAPHSGKEAVYYKAQIIRKYEYRAEEKDSNGQIRHVDRQSTEVVFSDEQQMLFSLEDGSGLPISIDISGAKKYTQKTIDKFVTKLPEEAHSFVKVAKGDTKTLGYTYKEEIIPIDIRLYVLGEASDRKGELTVAKPTNTQQTFIVSVKSEEELIGSLEGGAKNLLIGFIIVGVLGLISLIWGVIDLL
ncbi:MAG: E3 ubiquitin ligase family protein [Thermonemataceae bacterium]